MVLGAKKTEGGAHPIVEADAGPSGRGLLNDPKVDFGTDYNKCETQAYDSPKYQAGMKLIAGKSRGQCMAQLGCRLGENRDLISRERISPLLVGLWLLPMN